MFLGTRGPDLNRKNSIGNGLPVNNYTFTVELLALPDARILLAILEVGLCCDQFPSLFPDCLVLYLVI